MNAEILNSKKGWLGSNENICFHVGHYSFGFNGKELDKEGMGGGASTYDYGFRIYNSALAKFLSVDPLFDGYPWNSVYCFAENDVIRGIDLDGAEFFYTADGTLLGHLSGSSEIRVVHACSLECSKKQHYPECKDETRDFFMKNSAPLSSYKERIIEAVFTSILKSKFKDNRGVKVNSSSANEGALHNSKNEIFINRNFKGKSDKYLINNYYEMIAVMAHERMHDNLGDNNFAHFQIAKSVFEKYVKNNPVSAEYKEFTKTQMKDYLDGMKLDLTNAIAGAHDQDNSKEKRQTNKEIFNGYYQDYVDAINFYNKTYGTSLKPMDFNKYEKTNFANEKTVINSSKN